MRIEDPALGLLQRWLPANDEPERPQVQVATIDGGGRPDLRTVLLSEWDAEGFAFHTDTESRKAAQLVANPAATMLVLWPNFTRQLVIRGHAKPADGESLTRTFERRSPYLRQLAWQNSTALAQSTREERVASWAAFQREHDPTNLGAPTTWTGFVLRPDRLTFWESDPDGPSHRVEYRAGSGDWTEHHLAG